MDRGDMSARACEGPTQELPGVVDGEAILVQSAEALGELCSRLRGCDFVGMDTEFVRSRTYFPTLGLIQLVADGGVFLVDPLGVDDLSPLVEILSDQRLIKVFHSCQEDLEALYYLCGFAPGPVFDTQVAASFLGYGFQPGYGSLVKALFGVDLDKDETRSNWIKRPLSESQLTYAAQDVRYLPAMYSYLGQALTEQGRLSWAREECAALEGEARFETDAARYYLRMRSLWQFDRRGLAALRDLSAWREHEAMSRDLPRSFVLDDKVLRAVVRVWPGKLAELAAVEGMRPQVVRRSGKTILAMLRQARQLTEDELPPAQARPLHTHALKAAADEAKASLDRRAGELGLPPELLAPRKLVTDMTCDLFMGQADAPWKHITGWRRQAAGESLLRDLAERHVRQRQSSRSTDDRNEKAVVQRL
jgi:ribonuclease D